MCVKPTLPPVGSSEVRLKGSLFFCPGSCKFSIFICHSSFCGDIEENKGVYHRKWGLCLFERYRFNNLVTCSFPAVASWPCYTLFTLKGLKKIQLLSCFCLSLLWWLVRQCSNTHTHTCIWPVCNLTGHVGHIGVLAPLFFFLLLYVNVVVQILTTSSEMCFNC